MLRTLAIPKIKLTQTASPGLFNKNKQCQNANDIKDQVVYVKNF